MGFKPDRIGKWFCVAHCEHNPVCSNPCQIAYALVVSKLLSLDIQLYAITIVKAEFAAIFGHTARFLDHAKQLGIRHVCKARDLIVECQRLRHAQCLLIECKDLVRCAHVDILVTNGSNWLGRRVKRQIQTLQQHTLVNVNHGQFARALAKHVHVSPINCEPSGFGNARVDLRSQCKPIVNAKDYAFGLVEHIQVVRVRIAAHGNDKLNRLADRLKKHGLYKGKMRITYDNGRIATVQDQDLVHVLDVDNIERWIW